MLLYGQIEKNGGILKLIVQLLPGLNALRKSGSFFQDVFGLFRSIPEAVLRYDRFNFTKVSLFPVYVKDSL